jgi:UDP-glucuronate 4-epimerase
MPNLKGKILITGIAGFIGFHLAERMIKDSFQVVGQDGVNDYYDINLKYASLREHGIDIDKIDQASPV